MEQRKEKPTVEQVLRLVVREELNLHELRHKIQVGLDQSDRGEVFDGEEVLAELKQRAEERLRKSQQ